MLQEGFPPGLPLGSPFPLRLGQSGLPNTCAASPCLGPASACRSCSSSLTPCLLKLLTRCTEVGGGMPP